MIFETLIGDSCSAIPPLVRCPCLLETVFFTTRTCSTSTVPLSGKTRRTRPVLPRSEPVSTLTVSLRRIFKLCICSLRSQGSGVRDQPVSHRSHHPMTGCFHLPYEIAPNFRVADVRLRALLTPDP